VRLTLALIGLTLPAAAQILIEESRVPAAYRDFEQAPGERRLKCGVTAFKPRLDFGLRFQGGYILSVPLNQYTGPNHGWIALLRVTPEGRKPVFLLSGMRLPKVPSAVKVDAEVGGSYLLGEGRYTVDLVVVDDSDRVCRGNWKVQAKRSRSERSMTLRLPPGGVESLSQRHNVSRASGTRPYRLTVLVNAAPLFRRSTRLRAFDRELLIGTLAPLLELLPAQSVRLVLFSLEQQKRLYSKEDFSPEDVDTLARLLSSIELGTVDYNVLQNRAGHLDVLADLINAELKARPASDAVIFLGPPSRYFGKFPDSTLQSHSDDDAPFFYVRYSPFLGRATADFPDVIQSAVKAVRGRTFSVHFPAEFSKAIREIESRLPK
jgi:hypothetical protein